MYKYEEIVEVHLELTSRCNASCPQCPRNVDGGQVNPHLPLTELSLGDIKRIFPRAFVKQLHHIYMCGNYGDAMTARDTLEAFEYFRECNPTIRLRLYTNGSGRNPAWWRRLASTIDLCKFAIDGLSDTNAIYRRGTDWQKIMESVEAYIGAGGRAEWSFIVFQHNEHQVEEARRLSQRMGFEKFTVVKTMRFASTGRVQPKADVRDRKGAHAASISLPQNPDYQNQRLVQIDKLVRQRDDYLSYLNEVEVRCIAQRPNSIYVSAEGLVFPCCYVAQIYPWRPGPGAAQVWELINRLARQKDSLNALDNSLRQIIEGPFFQSFIPNGWNDTVADGKLRVCAQKCGRERV
jgi:MoaA/NifB/PqqE/SkfB family radical SAM enzyme